MIIYFSFSSRLCPFNICVYIISQINSISFHHHQFMYHIYHLYSDICTLRFESRTCMKIRERFGALSWVLKLKFGVYLNELL